MEDRIDTTDSAQSFNTLNNDDDNNKSEQLQTEYHTSSHIQQNVVLLTTTTTTGSVSSDASLDQQPPSKIPLPPSRATPVDSTTEIISDGASSLASSSRSFFNNMESQKATVPPTLPKSDCCVPSESVPPTLFSIEKLNQVIRIAVVEATSAIRIDLTKLPKDPQRVISDVAAANNSIFNAISNKFDKIVKMLQPSPPVSWNKTRRPVGEYRPILLLDSIVDALGFILATYGVWSLSDDQPGTLVSQMDHIAVSVSDLQKRLAQSNRVKGVKQQQSPQVSPTQRQTDTGTHGTQIYPPDMVEALGRLTSCLSEVLRSNLKVASSHLWTQSICDRCVLALTKGTDKYSVSPKANGCKAIKQVRFTKSTAEQQQNHVFPACNDNVGPFIKTVQTVMNSDLLCRLFESPELRTSLNCLQSIRSGLEELSQQRIFEWDSGLAEDSLPHRYAEMPIHGLIPEIRKTMETDRKIEDWYYYNSKNSKSTSNNISMGIKEVQNLLGIQLAELSTAFRALYRFVGSILGTFYEEPDIINELTDASVLSSYVTMVGFLFHHDLLALASWMVPVMSKVRKRIKQQTSAVNAVPEGQALEDGIATVCQPSKPEEQGCTPIGLKCIPASAASLATLLTSPPGISFTRMAESESLLSFFIPHWRKSRSDSQIGAPADRVNRILVWLAWEGGLASVYDAVQKCQQQCPEDQKSIGTATGTALVDCNGKKTRSTKTLTVCPLNDLVEESIVNAVTEGCKVVKDKLTNALQMLNQSVEWTGRGDDILEFCQRVAESISLRYLGELDLRNVKDINPVTVTQQAKWKTCLLANLARASLPAKSSQISTKVVEALPKLFGEYCHQSLFYHCPLPQLGPAPSIFSATSSSAATISRLDGVTKDLGLRITSIQNLAESSVLNSHFNCRSNAELTKTLNSLKSEFESLSDGVVKRHTNEISGHTDRLEKHALELQSIQQLTASHQKRIESHAIETKKLIESMNEYKGEIERLSKLQAEAVETCIEAALHSAKAAIDEAQESFQTPCMRTINELKLSIRNLEDLVKTQEENSKRLFSILDCCNDRLAEQKMEFKQSVSDSKVSGEKTLEELERLEQNDQAIRESLSCLNDNIKNMMGEFAESMIAKSKGELSAYLREQLSRCVNDHVVYNLERLAHQQQQSSSRRRLLAWAAAAMSHTSTPTNSSHATVDTIKDPALIQSIHRHKCSQRSNCANDDLTSIADSSSVMEESCAAETPLIPSKSWFADVQLLDMPDIGGRNRGSTSFVADSSDDFHRRSRLRDNSSVGDSSPMLRTPSARQSESRNLSQNVYNDQYNIVVEKASDEGCVDKIDAKYKEGSSNHGLSPTTHGGWAGKFKMCGGTNTK